MYLTIWRLVQLKNHLKSRLLQEPVGTLSLSREEIDRLSDTQILMRSGVEIADVAYPAGNLLSLIAFVFGAVTMSGLLISNANQPINLLYILLVFGPLQWMLMALALVALFQNRIPFFNQFMPKKIIEFGVPDRMLGSFFFHLNQTLSVSFLFGAVSVFGILLVIQDLSFGWQSTINTDNFNLKYAFSVVSSPWAWFWPEAVPSDQLIQSTRYYQIASGDISLGQARNYGLWWQFVVAFLVFYTFIPRFILWIFAQLKLSAATKAWVLTDPHFQKLVRDIRSIKLVIETRNKAMADSVSGHGNIKKLDLQSVSNLEAEVIFSWKVDASYLPEDMVVQVISLGLPNQWQQDQDVIAESQPMKSWNIFVPGWEPPTAELTDLIAPFQVKNQIRLIPIALKGQLSDNQWLSWQQFQQRQLPAVELVNVAQENVNDI